MRKYFEGLSFLEGALLISSLLFGVFLRFQALDIQSPWTDELASWFYLRNLDKVFYYESHSPFYYFILRLFLGKDASLYGIRFFSALLSTGFLISIFFLAQKTFHKSKVILLIILLSMCPPDIVYSRMARHYSLLLEGTLIFYFLIQNKVRTWIPCVVAFSLGFIHVFALIPIICILAFDVWLTREWRRNLVIMISSFGVGLYYIARMMIFGSREVGSNVSWNTNGFFQFMRETILQFFGDAYPRNQFFHVSFLLSSVIILSLLAFILWKRKRSGILLVSVWITSILFIEFLDLFWINLRISRYVIYISGLLIIAFVDALPDLKKQHLTFAFLCSLVSIIPLKLIMIYPWDDEVVQEFKVYVEQYPEHAQLICCNKYQKAYYGLKAPLLCRDAIHGIDLKRPVLFLDLNNNDSYLALFLTQKMYTQDYRDLKHSRIILFNPR